jgi:hypothetical protein
MEGMGFGPYGGGHTMPSGFEGLFFMLQICDELHVYGFDPQTDKDVKYHYFDGIEVAQASSAQECHPRPSSSPGFTLSFNEAPSPTN